MANPFQEILTVSWFLILATYQKLPQIHNYRLEEAREVGKVRCAIVTMVKTTKKHKKRYWN